MLLSEKMEALLKAKLEKGLEQNEAGRPILKLRNGKVLIIESTGEKYIARLDFGTAAIRMGKELNIKQLVKVIMEESDMEDEEM